MTLFALILSPLMIPWFLFDGSRPLLSEVIYGWFYCWQLLDAFSPLERDSFHCANHPFHGPAFQSASN